MNKILEQSLKVRGTLKYDNSEGGIKYFSETKSRNKLLQ